MDPEPIGSNLTASTAKAARSASEGLTIRDRLECGNLTVDEVCALKSRGKTGFYEDVKAGLVILKKVGRKSIIPGPIAKRYIAGLPLEDVPQDVAA